jgi:hypothetical protein
MTDSVVLKTTYPVVVNNTVLNTVSVDSTNTVVVDNNKPIVILSGQMGPPGVRGASSLTQLDDVDITQNLEQDSVLMYSQTSGKWIPSKKLESHLVNAGFF